MTDVLIGAVWTLICVTLGFLIGLFLWLFLGDRGDPGPHEDDPEPDPWSPESGIDFLDPTTPPVDRWREELDGPIPDWLSENTVTEPFESRLKP